MALPTPKIIPDRDRYRKYYLDADYSCRLTNGDILLIDKGYRFDGHSVPFIFRWLFPKWDDDAVAALIHDFLVDTSPWHRYTRVFIDEQYRYFMEQNSVSRWRTFWMPKAVRFYGYWRFDFWGDKRGELKPGTSIRVVVDNGII